MMILDNINQLFGDDLKRTIRSGARLKIAAATFSIYAYEALRKELEKIHSLEFIFTAPTFVPEQVRDRVRLTKQNKPTEASAYAQVCLRVGIDCCA